MSVKLSQSDRRQIITDHLNGIPNELYYVIVTSNGTYQVRRKKEAVQSTAKPLDETPAQPLEQPSARPLEQPLEQTPAQPLEQPQAQPPSHSHNEVTNDQVLGRLQEMLGEPQPQAPPIQPLQHPQASPFLPRRRVLRL